MKVSKKLAVLFLALCLLLAVSGCRKLGQIADAVDAKPFSIGTVEGNRYVNDFISLQCELDDEWDIYTHEQLAQLSGVVSDMFTDEEVRELVEDSSSVFVYYAENLQTYASVNITVSNTESYGAALTDHDELVDAISEQMPEMLAQSYMEDIVCKPDTFSFCGEDEYGIYISATAYGLPMYERQVIIVEGTYTIALTVCTYMEDTTMDLLKLFSSYEG